LKTHFQNGMDILKPQPALPYDFDRKGFEIDGFDPRKLQNTPGGFSYRLTVQARTLVNNVRYNTNLKSPQVRFVNREEFSFFPVADETLARKIEKIRTDDAARLRIYFYVQKSGIINTKNGYGYPISLEANTAVITRAQWFVPEEGESTLLLDYAAK